MVVGNKIRNHISAYLRDNPHFIEWFELEKEAPYKPLISPSPTPSQAPGVKQVNKLKSKQSKKVKEKSLDEKSQPKVATSKYKFEQIDLSFANLLLDLILKNTPTYKIPNSLEGWANEFRLIREVDKRTEKQIEYVIKWSQNDSFWKSNILSASAVRRQFDKMVSKIQSAKNTPVKGGITILQV